MKLSICVPTYNRRLELLRLIDSIAVAKQALPTAAIEVVVSDNASTDGTEGAMLHAQSNLSWLLYSRNSKNEGFASNLNRAIALSSGEYCWLMGSDDLLLPDAMARVWQHLEHDLSVIVGNPVTRSVERRFFLFDKQHDQKFAYKHDYEFYVSRCREISSTFAYISTLIVRRDFWTRVECTQFEIEHPYTHMLRIVRGLATTGGSVRCLNAPLVVTGHVSNEWNATVLPIFELDVSTIGYIATTLFDSSPSLIAAYGTVFRRQYAAIELMKSRVQCTQKRWNAMTPLLRKFGYPQILLQKTFLDPTLLAIYLRIKEFRRRAREGTPGPETIEKRWQK